MGDRLVILDVADPLAPAVRTWLRPGSPDTFVSADSPEACAWLTSVAGLDVQSARQLCSESRMQGSIEDLARGTCSGVPFLYRDVDVAPSVEYGLVLALVSALRDIDLCNHVSLLRRSGASWSQVVLLTDRRRTRGLVRCLMRAAGTRRSRVAHCPQLRYLDGTLELSRPTRRSFRHGVWARKHAQHSSAGGQAVLVAQRLAMMLEDSDGARENPPTMALPDGVWDLLSEYLSRQGPWRWTRLLQQARQRASGVCVSVAAYLAGTQDCLSTADLSYLLRDYVYPACVSGLLRGALGVEAVLGRASTRELTGLLVWNDVLPHHRGMVDAARHLGVRSVMWQHGVFALRTLHDRPRVDVVAVWGETSKRWLMSTGFPVARIRLVGAPSIAETAVPSRAAQDGERNRVLYTSEGYVGMRLAEDLTEGIKTLCLVADASSASSCVLTAKAHPIEATRSWGSGLRSSGRDMRLCLSAPIPQLLRDTDVMISRSSTTVLEARLAGLPVLLLNDAGEGAENPYAGLEGVRQVSAETLVEALGEIRASGRLASRRDDAEQTVALSDVLCATGAAARAQLRDLLARELTVLLAGSDGVHGPPGHE
jgi:hypothetical protein